MGLLSYAKAAGFLVTYINTGVMASPAQACSWSQPSFTGLNTATPAI